MPSEIIVHKYIIPFYFVFIFAGGDKAGIGSLFRFQTYPCHFRNSAQLEN
jgi:hypothetical protein